MLKRHAYITNYITDACSVSNTKQINASFYEGKSMLLWRAYKWATPKATSACSTGNMCSVNSSSGIVSETQQSSWFNNISWLLSHQEVLTCTPNTHFWVGLVFARAHSSRARAQSRCEMIMQKVGQAPPQSMLTWQSCYWWHRDVSNLVKPDPAES